jgi:hypothetical protein
MSGLPKAPTDIDIAIANNENLNEGIFNEINKMKNKDALRTALDGSDERRRRLENFKNNKQAPNGGSKRNKKSVRRLVKKRNTKRRKSRRVKH